MPGEDAAVVSMAVDGPGVCGHPVFLEAGRRLGDGARKVDARHSRALPERRLRGQLGMPERRHAQIRQVEQWRDEAGGRDDLVRFDLKSHAVVGAPGPDHERIAAPGYVLDRGVKNRHTAAQHVVFVGLHVAGAHSDQ